MPLLNKTLPSMIVRCFLQYFTILQHANRWSSIFLLLTRDLALLLCSLQLVCVGLLVWGQERRLIVFGEPFLCDSFSVFCQRQIFIENVLVFQRVYAMQVALSQQLWECNKVAMIHRACDKKQKTKKTGPQHHTSPTIPNHCFTPNAHRVLIFALSDKSKSY